jgi:hypothetical protein
MRVQNMPGLLHGIAVLIVIGSSLIAQAEPVVVVGRTCIQAKDRIPIERQTSITEFESKVAAAGYDPSTLFLCYRPSGIWNSLKKDQRLSTVLTEKSVNVFSAKKNLSQDESLRKDFINNFNNNKIAEIVGTLESLGSKTKMTEFISSCTVPSDHNKIPLYYACRKGHIKLIEQIKNTIGIENFTNLMRTLDSENRTLLMAAAQATSNRLETIELIKTYMPHELLTAKDENNCTAYDWAILRDHTDTDTLSALMETRGDGSVDSSSPPAQVSETCKLKPVSKAILK